MSNEQRVEPWKQEAARWFGFGLSCESIAWFLKRPVDEIEALRQEPWFQEAAEAERQRWEMLMAETRKLGDRLRLPDADESDSGGHGRG